MRETSHLVVETVGGRWFLISSLANKQDTQLITIERYTGRLLYTGQKGIDLFSTPREALEKVSMGKKILKTVTKCQAIVGYYICGGFGYLVVITKTSLDLTLPPEHKVYTVKESGFITISLGYPVQQNKNETKNMELLLDYPLNGLHFYCETLDLTCPFPNSNSVYFGYDKEFRWNEFISEEFRRIGMNDLCCILLQGLSVGKQISSKKDKISIGMLTKRSNLNPGTRYFSRGLNYNISPGNEYEFEIIVWNEQEKQIINWSSFIGRRGTVPIHWKSEINSQFQDAQIIISEEPFKNVQIYYDKIFDKYKNIKKLTLLNLLRFKDVHPQEGNLANYFKESLKEIKNDKIQMLNFDWLTNKKLNGFDFAVEKLWETINGVVEENSINSGTFRLNSSGKILDSKISMKQNGLFRVNCADSLDRTNLSIFFITLKTIPNLLKNIGVESLCPIESEALQLSKVKNEFSSFLLMKLSEMFINNGDVCSLLFTNTVAMHTEHLREFAEHLPKAQSNTKIIVERRIQNTIFDKSRNAQYEMFLGMNFDQYFDQNNLFSSIDFEKRLRYCSPYPSFILKDIPTEINSLSQEFILLNSSSKYFWICPRDFDFVEVFIYLPFYCKVTEFSLTLRHGLNELTSPRKVDIFFGKYLNENTVGFQELQLPRCEDSTKLLYSTDNSLNQNNSNTLYNFNGKIENYNMRVVRLTFYGLSPGNSMTLGPIQIFGIQKENLKPFHLTFHQNENVKEEILLNFDDDEIKKEDVLLDFGIDEIKQGKEIKEIQTQIQTQSQTQSQTQTQTQTQIQNELENKEKERKKEYLLNIKKKLTFTNSLELELLRLKLKMTTEERDDILVQEGFKVSNFDPNQFIYKRDDKIETFIRKKSKTNNCYSCSASIKLIYVSCRYCSLSFCKNCISKDKISITEFKWNSPQIVCQTCFNIIKNQNEMIKEIKKLISIEENRKIQDGNFKTDLLSINSFSKNLNEFNQNEYCLNEFPNGGILSSVETHHDSYPIESILFKSLSNDIYWFAPNNINDVSIIITLPSDSILSKIVLINDKIGYENENINQIKISIGNRLPKFTTSNLNWNLKNLKPLQKNELILNDDLNPSRLIRIDLNCSKQSFLHLGRILIFGKPFIPKENNFKLNEIEDQKYQSILQSKQKTSKVQLKSEILKTSDLNVLDLSLNDPYVSGFQLTIKHDQIEGLVSQVREIRITLLSNDQSNLIGIYTIPKVAQGTTLYYDFNEKIYENINIVRFEFLNNYGGQNMSVGKIHLWCSKF
eukprot:gene5190-8796_t